MEANNPYNSKTPNKYIMYLDANNMYGWAMSQCLPTGGFKWLTPNQINELDIHSLNPEAGKGLILEVDLEYSHELQDPVLRSVGTFCARFSDVILRGNQWWRREMLAVFSG